MDKVIKVLMVDDEEQFRETTKKILERKGYQTLLAKSGQAAIEKLKEHPDVVILDIKMPGMDGHQALKEIKKISPNLPVIMLTGHGYLESAKHSAEEGAFDYLTKPCDIDLLSSKIRDAHRSVKDPASPLEEKRVLGVMIPLLEYTTIRGEATVYAAIEKLKASFESGQTTSRLMETGHRSVLVLDENGQVEGMVTIVSLLQAMMPGYLTAAKPSTADTIEYSPMFWRGMFTRALKTLSEKRISEIMSPAPRTIDGDSSLMEAAYMMIKNKYRRLVVELDGSVVGVIREQDLFFEMEKILRKELSK